MTSESETCTSPTEIPAPAIATHLLEGGGVSAQFLGIRSFFCYFIQGVPAGSSKLRSSHLLSL